MKRADYLSSSPFNMSLSCGFFGFFAHLGFYTAFEERSLKPASISGSSGGALVAASVASGLSSREIRDLFQGISKKDFWDPALGAGFLKGKKFEDLLRKNLKSDFNELTIPLFVSVFNVSRTRTEVLSEGSVPLAVKASSAVPLFFHPVKIGEHFYLDGGIFDRGGVKGLIGSDKGQELVVHYLPAKGIWSSFEDRVLYRNLHDGGHFFKAKSLIKIGPNHLDSAAEVIDFYHRLSSSWLDEEVTPRR